MKNDCQKIQNDLLLGAASHDAHCRNCSDCRQFAEMLDLVSGVNLAEEAPGAELDHAVLAYARQRRKSRQPLRFVALLGAVAAIVIAVFVFTEKPGGQNSIGDDDVIVGGGESVPLAVSPMADPELSGMLQQVADAGFSGDHIDGDLLDLELQLAMMQTEAF